MSKEIVLKVLNPIEGDLLLILCDKTGDERSTEERSLMVGAINAVIRDNGYCVSGICSWESMRKVAAGVQQILDKHKMPEKGGECDPDHRPNLHRNHDRGVG